MGVLPGGVVGAGETGWDYFVNSRPVELLAHALSRAGIGPGFGHDFAAVGVATAAQVPVLLHAGGLAAGATGVDPLHRQGTVGRRGHAPGCVAATRRAPAAA
jgi:hypothetical protein